MLYYKKCILHIRYLYKEKNYLSLKFCEEKAKSIFLEKSIFLGTLGDFTLKTQNWEGISDLTKNRFRRKGICCAENNHSHMN